MNLESYILQNLNAAVKNYQRVFVAYSGGLDSSVLLHVLAQSNLKNRLTALHVHHGLSDHADAWVNHCRHQCGNLGVGLELEYAALNIKGSGVEAAARDARLAFFRSFLSEKDIVVTAHHLNDQIETHLYRLIRGSGLQGLSAMKMSRVLGEGHMVRPMLGLKRSELEAYASAHALVWVEDESNRSSRFDRNFIRNTLMPLITSRWPQAEKTIGGSVSNLQQENALLNDYLDNDLIFLGRRKEKVGESICLSSLSKLSRSRVHALLRRWCESVSIFAPDKQHLIEINTLITAKVDAQPCFRWGEYQFRRYKSRLYLLPHLGVAPEGKLNWRLSSALDLGGGFKISARISGEEREQIQSTQVCVAFDKAGLRCKPLTRSHSQTIKKLFQEYAVEPWLRPWVPLIYMNNDLIAVGDYWLCDSPAMGKNIQFSWCYDRLWNG